MFVYQSVEESDSKVKGTFWEGIAYSGHVIQIMNTSHLSD